MTHIFYLGYIYRFYSQTDISTRTWYNLLKDLIDKESHKVIAKFCMKWPSPERCLRGGGGGGGKLMNLKSGKKNLNI